MDAWSATRSTETTSPPTWRASTRDGCCATRTASSSTRRGGGARGGNPLLHRLRQRRQTCRLARLQPGGGGQDDGARRSDSGRTAALMRDFQIPRGQRQLFLDDHGVARSRQAHPHPAPAGQEGCGPAFTRRYRADPQRADLGARRGALRSARHAAQRGWGVGLSQRRRPALDAWGSGEPTGRHGRLRRPRSGSAAALQGGSPEQGIRRFPPTASSGRGWMSRPFRARTSRTSLTMPKTAGNSSTR